MGQATSQPDTMASQATRMPSLASAAPAQTSTSDAAEKPRPCCVCKDEKAKRDECMLFSSAKDPEEDCKTTIQQYRSCMEGFGFKV
ncbi:hypothetical protein RB596_004982 [Gaeumannomyces avenae]